MFPSERQLNLNPVLSRLRDIKGITNVYQDDFNSTGINVFFTMKASQLYSGKAMKFELPLNVLNRNLKKLFKELGVEFRITDYPVMKYVGTSTIFRSKGDPVKEKVGYDQTRYGIEVFV